MAATVASAMPRIEIVSEHRRSHDAAFRTQVLAEARHPGVRVRDVARRHGICSSLIYRWRREAAGVVGCSTSGAAGAGAGHAAFADRSRRTSGSRRECLRPRYPERRDRDRAAQRRSDFA